LAAFAVMRPGGTREAHGFSGAYTITKGYIREHERRRREMFVPQSPCVAMRRPISGGHGGD